MTSSGGGLTVGQSPIPRPFPGPWREPLTGTIKPGCGVEESSRVEAAGQLYSWRKQSGARVGRDRRGNYLLSYIRSEAASSLEILHRPGMNNDGAKSSSS